MAGEKYTRQTASTYPDPKGTGGYGLEVKLWTDDAWNRYLQKLADSRARMQWHRDHPVWSAMGRGLGTFGRLINDEIFLNKDNIRVRNARAHPEVMNAIQDGGNIAGGIVAAPFLTYAAAELAPYAWQGLRALPRFLPRFGGTATEGTTSSGLTNLAAGGGRTMLMTTPEGATVAVPVGGAAASSMSIPSWVGPTAATLGTGYAAYETRRRLFPPFMATEDGEAAPADDSEAGSGVIILPDDYFEAGSGVIIPPEEEPEEEPEGENEETGEETGGESGGSPEGGAPNPNNGGLLPRQPKRSWWKWEGSGNPGGSKFPNAKRYFKNGLRLWGYGTGVGVVSDILGNTIQSANDLNHEWSWPATRIINTVPIKIYDKWSGLYAPAAPGDSLNTRQDSVPSDTITREAAPAPVVPVDSAALSDWTKALQNFSVEE